MEGGVFAGGGLYLTGGGGGLGTRQVGYFRETLLELCEEPKQGVRPIWGERDMSGLVGVLLRRQLHARAVTWSELGSWGAQNTRARIRFDRSHVLVFLLSVHRNFHAHYTADSALPNM